MILKFGLSNICFFPCIFFLVLSFILVAGAEINPLLARVLSLVHQNSWIEIALSSISFVCAFVGYSSLPRGKKTELEIMISSPKRVRLLELRYLFTRLSTMNLKPQIRFMIDFHRDKQQVVTLSGVLLINKI